MCVENWCRRYAKVRPFKSNFYVDVREFYEVSASGLLKVHVLHERHVACTWPSCGLHSLHSFGRVYKRNCPPSDRCFSSRPCWPLSKSPILCVQKDGEEKPGQKGMLLAEEQWAKLSANLFGLVERM